MMLQCPRDVQFKFQEDGKREVGIGDQDWGTLGQYSAKLSSKDQSMY